MMCVMADADHALTMQHALFELELACYAKRILSKDQRVHGTVILDLATLLKALFYSGLWRHSRHERT